MTDDMSGFGKNQNTQRELEQLTSAAAVSELSECLHSSDIKEETSDKASSAPAESAARRLMESRKLKRELTESKEDMPEFIPLINVNNKRQRKGEAPSSEMLESIAASSVVFPDNRHSLSNQGRSISKAKKKKQAKGSSYVDRKVNQIAKKKTKSQMKSKLTR